MADDNNILGSNLDDANERINRLQEQRVQFGKEEINDKKELLNVFKSVEASLSKQFSLMKDITSNFKSTTQLANELSKNNAKLNDIEREQLKYRQKGVDLLAQQISDQQKLLSEKVKETDALTKQVQTLKLQEDALRTQRKLTSTEGKQVRADLKAAAKDMQTAIVAEESAYKALIKLNQKDIDGATRKYVAYTNIVDTIQEENKALAEALRISRLLDRNIFNIAQSITSVIPQLGTITQSFEKAAKASREAGGGWKSLVAGSRSFAESTLAVSLVMGILVNEAFKADQQVTNIAKNMAISKQRASEFREEFANYARDNQRSYVTTSRLLEAQTNLNSSLSTAVLFTGKQLEDYIKINKLIGLSTDETNNLYKLGILNRKSVEDTTISILKGAQASQLQYNVALDNREVLREVSKLSAGILVKFQQNPVALGQAVVQAKSLGTTLQKVDNIGDSLLDFEGSLERTLKAELLTGRELNLERARSAALLGDQRTLMTEISSQTGDLKSFTSLNVLAQRSLAEAFGLSRDELAQMLVDQEKFNALGDTSRMTLQEQLKLAKERGVSVESQLYMSLQQQAAQEKFNQTIEKLQDTLANLVAGPFGQLLDAMANLLNNATMLKIVFGAIAAIIGGKMVSAMSQFISKAIISLGLSESEAGAKVLEANALTLGLGSAAIIAGTIATMAAVGSILTPKEVKDGVIGPNDRILYSGGKGSIKFDPNDTIVAGTNLGNGSSNGNSDEKLDRIAALLEKISQKDTNVYLSESKLAMATATPIGTNIQKNMTSFA